MADPAPDADLISELAAALPDGAVLTDPDLLRGHRHDEADLVPSGMPAVVVRPRTTAEVAAVVRIAAARGVPVVPQGARTGLAGAANAVEGAVVLSTTAMDRILLRLPIFGAVIRKATIARWTRTLSTMFAAGVPLVEALDSVGGASGNDVYLEATRKIQTEVSTGTSLTISMQNVNVFPNMVTQMVQIGEESGSLDAMLGKVADFFEEEVDDAVAALSSLMEPLIMVILGVLIGGLVIAMYLPIFKLGSVV